MHRWLSSIRLSFRLEFRLRIGGRVETVSSRRHELAGNEVIPEIERVYKAAWFAGLDVFDLGAKNGRSGLTVILSPQANDE
jgi:hypothetical protein